MADQKEVKKILGIVMPFQVGQHMVNLYPVMLLDWPEFGTCVMILEHERLQNIFEYADGAILLLKLFRIVTKLKPEDPLPEIFNNITQADYIRFREIVMSQNDLDFSHIAKLRSEASKKAATLPSA